MGKMTPTPVENFISDGLAESMAKADAAAPSGFPALLVLSHHRSGSNFITEVLQYNRSIELLNEPLSMHTDFFLKHDLVPWKAEDFNEDLFHAEMLPYPGVSTFLREMRAYFRDANPGILRGFKETLLFEKLPWLKRFMPELKVMYILRDPRSVINSVKKNRMWKIWDYEKNIPRFLMQSHLYDFLEMDMPDFLSSPTNLALLSWKIRYQFAKKSLGDFRSITVKLEDFLLDTAQELKRTMSFLELEPAPSQHEFVRKSGMESRGKSYSVFRNHDEVLYGWRNGLGKDEIRHIEHAVGPEMEELGYL